MQRTTTRKNFTKPIMPQNNRKGTHDSKALFNDWNNQKSPAFENALKKLQCLKTHVQITQNCI